MLVEWVCVVGCAVDVCIVSIHRGIFSNLSRSCKLQLHECGYEGISVLAIDLLQSMQSSFGGVGRLESWRWVAWGVGRMAMRSEACSVCECMLFE